MAYSPLACSGDVTQDSGISLRLSAEAAFTPSLQLIAPSLRLCTLCRPSEDYQNKPASAYQRIFMPRNTPHVDAALGCDCASALDAAGGSFSHCDRSEPALATVATMKEGALKGQ